MQRNNSWFRAAVKRTDFRRWRLFLDDRAGGQVQREGLVEQYMHGDDVVLHFEILVDVAEDVRGWLTFMLLMVAAWASFMC